MDINKYIMDELFKNQDLEYREFNSKLIPNVNKDTMIGVRTPVLRNISKHILKNYNYDDFLNSIPHKYFEENNLHGFLIERENDFEKAIKLIDDFLPVVDNWETCDLFSPVIFKKYSEKSYAEILRWLESEHTYTKRFAIVSLMSKYLDERFETDMLYKVAEIKSDEYYINMAIAWYLSFALIKQYDVAIKLIEEKSLDKFVQNKSIQKAVESRRISDDRKLYLKSLKIK
ncbi:DNA alkylation repair protein [Peptoniphilus sp. oral taxon 386]|uniref:DNA alkylation repair protein n=1 Tax=Peptoniphilus sp. oral taxon 386 TaxID=652713 RepID=UPI0001DA9C5A|nr:DNA alkylation repair protein [Peptoniphilus sp. oral taxon 386]EFI42635.1 hypothetical protein HMPREF0629_01294 [Peptoniphilus sp. oral taxon 386 str. F0131]